MSGRLIVNQIEGKSGASNIVTVPSGHRVVGVDTGSVYAPGSIVQFQYAEFATETSTTSTSWATLFSLNFTPKYSNSYVLVQSKVPFYVFDNSVVPGGGFRILRGSTVVDDASGDINGALEGWLNATLSGYRDLFNTSIRYGVDSPGTTSQITYNLQWIRRAGTVVVNYDADKSSGAHSFNPKCVMTAMEIAR